MADDKPKGVSFELPNPAGLTLSARQALARGSGVVAFPVPDVLKLADDLSNVLTLLAGMKSIIDTQAISGRVVVELGREILRLAGDGNAGELAMVLGPFEAAIEALDSALPEADQEAEATPPLAN